MNRREFVKLSSFAAIGLGSKKLPSFSTRNIPPPLVTTNLIGQWNFVEGWNQIVFNRTGPATYPSFTNLYGTGSEQFAANVTNNEGWTFTAGVALTDFFATDPFGNNGATRLTATAGAGHGISNNKTLSVVQYTVSFYVKSNTGSTQQCRLSNVTSTSSDLNVTTSWTQISFTFTGTSGVNAVGLINDSSNNTLDILIYGAILQTGAAASTYTPAIFDLQLGSLSVTDAHDPTWQTYGVDLGNSIYTYGIGTVGSVTTNFTAYIVAKKTGADASGGFEPMISNGNAGLASFFALNTVDVFSDPAQGNQRPDFLFGTAHAYANSINLTDNKWHVFAATYDGATLRFYLDGTEIASLVSTQTALTIHRMYFGEYPNISSSLYYFPGSVGISAIYSAAHSPATVRQMVATLQGDMACRSIAVGPQPQFIMIEGDSISDCNLISTGLTIYQGWGYLMFHDISPVVQGRNFATGGATLTTMTARAAQVDATFNPDTASNILAILIGRNDFALGNTPAQFVSNYKTYCIARKTANPLLKIGIIPVLPSTAATFNTWRNTANALIAADPDFTNGVAADIIATVDPTLWADAAASNLTLYSDGTHPTATGMTYLEPVAKTMCTALF